MGRSYTNELDCSPTGLIKLTLPILLALWSTHLLNIVNRALLLQHSPAVLNVAALSISYCGAFTAFFYRVARIASVYTGQLNGARDHQHLASPMWQMIYLALFSTLFFLPMTYLVQYSPLLPDNYANEIIHYRQLIFGTAPFFIAYTALLAFFSGKGKTKLIATITIAGGVIRTLLNYLLIGGIPGKLPALGAIGNAYAQIFVKIVEFSILGYCLIAGVHVRIDWQTCRFNLKLFLNCIKTGFPLALNSFLALAIWHLIHLKLSHYSTELTTVWSISSSIFICLNFASQGIGKATAIAVSNLIGKQNLSAIHQVYRRFLLISLVLALILCGILTAICFYLSRLYPHINLTIVLIWIYINLVIELLLATTNGVLRAGGDTLFPQLIQQISLWLVVALPILYLFLTDKINSIVTIYQCSAIWSGLNLVYTYYRYRSLVWYQNITM